MRRKQLTDELQGRRDGFEGCEQRRNSPEYLAGHAAGRQEREAAHERMNHTCRRFAGYTTVRRAWPCSADDWRGRRG
jgi:hypothetical protein